MTDLVKERFSLCKEEIETQSDLFILCPFTHLFGLMLSNHRWFPAFQMTHTACYLLSLTHILWREREKPFRQIHLGIVMVHLQVKKQPNIERKLLIVCLNHYLFWPSLTCENYTQFQYCMVSLFNWRCTLPWIGD